MPRFRPMTQDKVARLLGVSRSRVDQIERSALRKLRAALRREGLTLEDLVAGDRGDVSTNERSKV